MLHSNLASFVASMQAMGARRTWAFANQKGGVGKTSTTLLLARALHVADARVLVVDCDPQASATKTVDIDTSQTVSLADVLVGRDATRRPCRLEAQPLAEVESWLENYRQFWEVQFQRLDGLLEELKAAETGKTGKRGGNA